MNSTATNVSGYEAAKMVRDAAEVRVKDASTAMSTKVIDLLNKLAFNVETVAHMRGLEHELLPLCDEARAMAASLAAPQAKREMSELMDEYENELRATVAKETSR